MAREISNMKSPPRLRFARSEEGIGTSKTSLGNFLSLKHNLSIVNFISLVINRRAALRLFSFAVRTTLLATSL